MHATKNEKYKISQIETETLPHIETLNFYTASTADSRSYLYVLLLSSHDDDT